MADLRSHSPIHNPWKLGGLSWPELGVRLWREGQNDELVGRAAQLGFYLVLALFPTLLFLTALLGLFPLQPIIPELLAYLREVLPADALSLLEKYLQQVVEGSGGSLLSLGLVGALWATSSGLTAIMDALTVVYDTKETRTLWKIWVTALAMTIGLAGFIILSAALVLVGEHIAQGVANFLGLGELFTIGWMIVQWPLIFVLMLVAVAAIYYFSPNVEQDWRWVTPGSLVAVVLWVAVSLGFKLYVENFGNYNVAYGSIGGGIVLMLWFYLSGIALLIGGELNAEIGKAAGKQARLHALPPPVRKRSSA
ncbi:MAG TPA: YihY/virulence factor BrkB family protein [Nitrospira sp.]|nr:YihY/virulence factor BrkB family protein [Nitrospira sp.]